MVPPMPSFGPVQPSPISIESRPVRIDHAAASMNLLSASAPAHHQPQLTNQLPSYFGGIGNDTNSLLDYFGSTPADPSTAYYPTYYGSGSLDAQSPYLQQSIAPTHINPTHLFTNTESPLTSFPPNLYSPPTSQWGFSPYGPSAVGINNSDAIRRASQGHASPIDPQLYRPPVAGRSLSSSDLVGLKGLSPLSSSAPTSRLPSRQRTGPSSLNSLEKKSSLSKLPTTTIGPPSNNNNALPSVGPVDSNVGGEIKCLNCNTSVSSSLFRRSSISRSAYEIISVHGLRTRLCGVEM